MIQIDPQSLPTEPPLSKAALTRFLNRARKLVGLSGDVEVLLTTDAELKRLNRTFRNKNKPTDILSFPTPPEISAHHAGDLAISLETAARQATQHGHTLPEELRILILHGLLHLSGMDHETDSGEMAARESTLRATLKLPSSLIFRTSTATRARTIPAIERAKGQSHTSLGQRPRSATTKPKRAEGPTYTPRHKPKRATP